MIMKSFTLYVALSLVCGSEGFQNLGLRNRCRHRLQRVKMNDLRALNAVIVTQCGWRPKVSRKELCSFKMGMADFLSEMAEMITQNKLLCLLELSLVCGSEGFQNFGLRNRRRHRLQRCTHFVLLLC
ncbi:hypothetical protein L1887_05883 [Cichorium endivia]|nr:hypothetical protein L1887_05883 [Cichorium endivia]